MEFASTVSPASPSSSAPVAMATEGSGVTAADLIEHVTELSSTGKRSHQDLMNCFEKLMAVYGNDAGLFVLDSVKSLQTRQGLLCDVFGALEGVPNSGNAILQSSHTADIFNRLASKTYTEAVHKSFLELFLSSANRDSYLMEIAENNLMLLSTFCLGLIAHEDLGLSEKACLVLSDVTSSFTTPLNHLVETAKRHSADSVVFTRFLQIISHAASVGDKQFAGCVACGGVQLVIETCRSNDILLAIVTIELLHEFAKCRAGLSYLVLEGVMLWLMDTSAASDSMLRIEALREMATILSTASKYHLLDVTFFDNLQLANILRRFLLCLQEQLEEPREEAKVAGLSALTDFALCSPAALTVVMSDAGLRDTWLSLINSKVDVQAAVMNSVAQIVENEYFISSPVSGSSVGESSSNGLYDDLKKAIVAELASKRRLTVPGLITKFVFQPVDSLRVGALRLVKALGTLPTGWGLLLLFQDPSLKEFLVTAGTEVTRDCKEAKYEAIAIIAQNPQVSHFGGDLEAKLKKLVAHGPYYVPQKVEDPMTIDR
jgi:hypothetical protein